jgi:hypothetical protein
MNRHIQRATHLVFGCLFAGILVAFETGNEAICDALMVAAIVFVGCEALTVAALCVARWSDHARPRETATQPRPTPQGRSLWTTPTRASDAVRRALAGRKHTVNQLTR